MLWDLPESFDNIRVGGDLNLSRNPIIYLPKLKNVKGIFIKEFNINTQLEKI